MSERALDDTASAPATGTRPSRTVRRPARELVPGRLLAAASEIVMVGLLFACYDLGRILAAQDVSGADTNARRLLAVEDWLHLPTEKSVQLAALPHQTLIDAAGEYYQHVHFPLTAAVLLWLFVRRPEAYRWAKWSLVLASGVALVIHVLVPVTPPRLLDGLGMVDTGILSGDSPYAQSSPVSGISNQYAALPSLHVGWALLIAVVLIASGTSRLRWWWALHPIITLAVVVVTANHYWIDAAVGSALVLTALVLVKRRQDQGARRGLL
jgi:hypothetical protein